MSLPVVLKYLILKKQVLESSNYHTNVACTPEEFNHILLATFPKLDRGGGFELLRCKPQSRELMLFGPRVSSCPKLLRRQVGNSKIYIRPIQRDLSLEEVAVEEVEGVCSSLIVLLKVN